MCAAIGNSIRRLELLAPDPSTCLGRWGVRETADGRPRRQSIPSALHVPFRRLCHAVTFMWYLFSFYGPSRSFWGIKCANRENRN